MRARRFFFIALAATLVAASATAQAPSLPAKLSDGDFWKLVGDISEPGGYFRITDNFTSNEAEIGRLFTMLRANNVSGGVYMGVGPEQNLTYIAAIRPKMAFVVDIRRQAVMQHLMYKAMFEMSKDRADFVSMIFSRPRPAGLDTASSIEKIWNAFRLIPVDTVLGSEIAKKVFDRLNKTHKFVFTPEENGQLLSVILAFQSYGPGITTRGGAGGGGPARGGFDMMTSTQDSAGTAQSFLSTEENYRYVKNLEEMNLVVPVSGDFAGPKAVRAIGAWVKEHSATITAFYVSNVEQYLFQDGKAEAFYDNVRQLPLTDKSIFIRPYTLRGFGAYGGYVIVGGQQITQSRAMCPMVSFLANAAAGKVRTNSDATACVP